MSVKRFEKKGRELRRDVERQDKQLYNYASPEELEEARKLDAEPTSPQAWNHILDRAINEA